MDDGRTVADMNVPGMPWHLDGPKVQGNKTGGLEEIELTKAERRALVQGALMAVMPIALFFVGAYFLIFLFIHFIWLS